MKVIELFANRIGVPIAQLLRTNVPHQMSSGITNEKDLGAFEEDLNFQLNYIKMLVKEYRLEEALTCVGWAEAYVASAGAFASKISPRLLHRVPLLKGMAYLQSFNPNAALPELKKSLTLIGEADEEKAAAVHNLLGAAYYLLERPELAVQEHLVSMRAIHSGAVRDLNQHFSIHVNLANAYRALGDLKQALAVYRDVLPLFQDIHDPIRKADTYHGLAKAYGDAGDTSSAVLWYSRAREIYQEHNRPVQLATIDLNLAELMIEVGREENVEDLLKEASDILQTPEHETEDLLQNHLYRVLALWSHKHGQLEQAEKYVHTSLEYGRKASMEADEACSAVAASYSGTDKPILPGSACYPIHGYVETLRIAAMIAETRGLLSVADERFETALKWAAKTGANDTIHAINMCYAESKQQRGSDLDAMEYYKAAAQANHAMNRKSTGPAILVG
ncbi:MAG: tetratricopeptide repeat protein [Chloroflexia bacterium]